MDSTRRSQFKGQAMTPKWTRLRWLVWVTLLASLLWLVFAQDKAPATELVSERISPTRMSADKTTGRNSTQSYSSGLIPRHHLIDESPRAVRRDLFSSSSWAPPPARSSSAAVIPVAPPLPFTYLGKKEEAGVWEVYLSQGERTFVVKTGQSLDVQYRVDKIDPPHMQLTYLPLGQAQSLVIGEPR
jgi:hypothetical protein